MLPLQVRVDLGILTMKGYSTFPKTPELELHQIQLRVIPKIIMGVGGLCLYREAVGIFYSPIQ